MFKECHAADFLCNVVCLSGVAHCRVSPCMSPRKPACPTIEAWRSTERALGNANCSQEVRLTSIRRRADVPVLYELSFVLLFGQSPTHEITSRPALYTSYVARCARVASTLGHQLKKATREVCGVESNAKGDARANDPKTLGMPNPRLPTFEHMSKTKHTLPSWRCWADDPRGRNLTPRGRTDE